LDAIFAEAEPLGFTFEGCEAKNSSPSQDLAFYTLEAKAYDSALDYLSVPVF
jgi:hypothetical protein